MPARSWSRLAGCCVAAGALLAFTALTISTREANTRAVLMKMQSLNVPPAPKLSYGGPMYSGGGTWKLHGKTIKHNILKAESVAGKELHHMHGHGPQHASAHHAVQHQQHHVTRQAWEKAAPGLAADVRTAEDLVKSGKKHLSDINDGFEKAFDVHDAKVHVKRPVKVLWHV